MPRPTADVSTFETFEEALGFFRRRVPMPAERFYALEDQAREKAFTVSGVARADLMNEVLASLDEAIVKGQTLEEWKKAIGWKLVNEWQGTVGDPGFRLETIFRTNVQTASSHGRIRQMSDPAVVRLRPFRLFDATRDEHTTDTCEERDNTLLEWDDPWWGDNTPPLHHRCRSKIRSLRRAQAARKGGVKRPGDEIEAPSPGFGTAPDLGVEVTQVDPDATRATQRDATLEAIRQRKERERKARQREEAERKREEREAEQARQERSRRKAERDAKKRLAAEREQERPPTAGVTEEERATFGAAASALRRGSHREAREGLRNTIGTRLDLQSRDVAKPRSGQYVEESQEGGIGGYHDWDGAIVVTPGWVSETAASLEQLSRGERRLRPRELQALHTAIHEELHGYSPIERHTYGGWRRSSLGGPIFSGAAAVEEVANELVTRRVTTSLTGESWTGVAGAYDRLLYRAARVVAEESGQPLRMTAISLKIPGSLIDRMTEAAIQFKRKHSLLQPPPAPREFVELFVRELELQFDLTPEQTRSLVDRLMQEEPEWAPEGVLYALTSPPATST